MTPDPKREDNEHRMRSNGKLGRILDKYELDGLGDRIEDRWLGESETRYSLRELATRINRKLLAAKMHEAGLDPLDGEVENTYRLLTDDDVTTGERTRARRRLQRGGIDVDELGSDFVSRQAVHTYLTKDRGVSYSTDDGDALEREARNVRRLNQRMTTVTDDKLERLRKANRLTIGEFETLVDIRVLCEGCDTQYQVGELLDRGRCDCRDPT